MPLLPRALLLLISFFNVLPGIVALVPSYSVSLYGIALDGSGLALALRHRAVLLASIGLFLALAAFDERWWMPAVALALASKVSFLLLFGLAGRPAGPLRRVAIADAVLLVLLSAVAILEAQRGVRGAG